MNNAYIRTWRFIEMEQWDQDYIDLVVPGDIALRENHLGEFQLGTVEGSLDYHIESYGDGEHLEFSWEGSDETDLLVVEGGR